MREWSAEELGLAAMCLDYAGAKTAQIAEQVKTVFTTMDITV